jgi:hypothetical protein
VVQNAAAATPPDPVARPAKREARLTTALASSELLDSFRTQLRSQSVDIHRHEAENAEQRAVIKSLRVDFARLQAVQQADAQDLVHLASRLLALAQAAGVELDNNTKDLFRRRGWTSTSRKPKAQQQ